MLRAGSIWTLDHATIYYWWAAGTETLWRQAATSAARKSIFRYRLWRPGRQRKHVQRQGNSLLSRDRDFRVSSTNDQLIAAACVNAHSVATRPATICSAIIDGDIDLLVITETSHECSDSVALKNVTPSGYSCLDAARPLQPNADLQSLAVHNYGGVTSVRLWQREFDLACPKPSKLSLNLIL